ncbi:unnamed protein product [Effrenium voratum]|nr:unnamed protein product [Effrenium voratum]
MVLGVRVHGPDVVNAEVKLDETFRPVPIPAKLGIPVLFKAQPGTGGDDSHIRSSAIVRFMADTDGLAPMEWQYGGDRGPAPPVVLARKDRLPLSSQDFHLICKYMSYWMEEAEEAEEHMTEVSNRILEPNAFQAYVREHAEDRSAQEHPLAFLSLQFPLRSTVLADGLEASDLNGQQGEVVDFTRDRVGVEFPDAKRCALRPCKLKLQREPPSEREPKAKRPALDKEERKKELERQEALQIAKRFHECLFEDTFPEMGDLHLFGVGCDYKARATEVLAVWQGLVKHMDFTAEQIAEALIQGNMKERFTEWTQKLAESRTPNSTYATNLIAAHFAATEWDEL